MPHLVGKYRDGKCWLWMTLKLLSNDVPYVHPLFGDRSDDLAGQGSMLTICRACWVTTESAHAVKGNCSPDHNSRYRSSVSRLQTGWLQVLTWPLSNQHTAITGTKAEPAYIRKHIRYPLRPPMGSSVTPLTSQTAVVWSQWNARYKASGSELSLK
ncbi:hypothetical protein AVEN_84604-1 [Araneus ventricosus]|uniref:Uncharacterized protein n=1 Tax=Araneus ventricosus TaxID=182803 RepID=A0A4Y2C194_ARAVE|nr:hypothetical protein AVEN_84604-1 [Araneus ventricosus]